MLVGDFDSVEVTLVLLVPIENTFDEVPSILSALGLIGCDVLGSNSVNSVMGRNEKSSAPEGISKDSFGGSGT
jgi:hypothetical protein